MSLAVEFKTENQCPTQRVQYERLLKFCDLRKYLYSFCRGTADCSTGRISAVVGESLCERVLENIRRSSAAPSLASAAGHRQCRRHSHSFVARLRCCSARLRSCSRHLHGAPRRAEKDRERAKERNEEELLAPSPLLVLVISKNVRREEPVAVWWLTSDATRRRRRRREGATRRKQTIIPRAARPRPAPTTTRV